MAATSTLTAAQTLAGKNFFSLQAPAGWDSRYFSQSCFHQLRPRWTPRFYRTLLPVPALTMTYSTNQPKNSKLLLAATIITDPNSNKKSIVARTVLLRNQMGPAWPSIFV